MITKNEINVLNLSPTKKDFVQIWNELLEVAGKLSERWDPTSTNESDPGIVILKALAGIADKLNYNIDKNTLEAFMPTAAQEDSMRKLCEMLGYNIKYYQSAKTEVTFRYYNPSPSEDEITTLNNGLYIPKFTVVTNTDQDINYFTIPDELNKSRPVRISLDDPTIKITCMEGQLVKCESSNEYNIITVNQISADNRFYLPETQIAENGIFVYNVFYNTDPLEAEVGLTDGAKWEKVDNLNTQPRGSKVYKFGFDSYMECPYIEFPDDYSNLFGEGLFIYYTRTRGVNGNISAHTLTQLELPSLSGWDKVSADSFSVDNLTATTTGANIESIKQAYNNFKKTIGTFDTLVTCRDYMNKIYSMMDEYGNPEVSNILVTDIRNDINRAITICSCDDAGILYKEKARYSDDKILTEEVLTTTENEHTKPYFDKSNTSLLSASCWHLGSKKGLLLVAPASSFITSSNANNFAFKTSGEVYAGDTYWEIHQNGEIFKTNLPCKRSSDKIITKTVTKATPKIDHFDLVFYPFKSYSQIRSSIQKIQPIYDESFKCVNTAQLTNLINLFESSDLKTIPHVFKRPEIGDLISINNYLCLNATIATTSKLTAEEGNLIILNVKKALANAFNMRELDFGEEIPFESIVEVMEKADARIKLVSLNDPSLYTTFSVLDNISALGVPEVVEYAVASKWLTTSKAESIGKFTSSTFNSNEAKAWYNKLVVRNILAGRVPLFKYSKTFQSDFYEAPLLLESNVDVSSCPTELIEQDQRNVYCVYWSDEENCIYARYYTGAQLEGTVFSRIAAPYASIDNVISAPMDTTIIDSLTVYSTSNDTNGSGEENNLSNGSGSADADDDLVLDDESPDNETPGSSSGKPGGGNSSNDDDNNNDDDDGNDDGNDEDDNNNNNDDGDDDNDDDKTPTGPTGTGSISSIYTPTIGADPPTVIEKITPYCEIIVNDKDNGKEAIRNFTIGANEFIELRAPEYTTEVTYPAYVNYHLKLNTEYSANNSAAFASAKNLYEIINQSDATREKVLEHFRSTQYIKNFTIKQKISKYTPSADTESDICNGVGNEGQPHVKNTSTGKCSYCGKKVIDSIQKGPIQVVLSNKNDSKIDELDQLLVKSSFIKLKNKDFMARLEWDTSDGDTAPKSEVPIPIKLTFKDPSDASYYITDEDILTSIQTAVTEAIAQSKNNIKSATDPTPILPTACAWTVSFDFECAPFEPASIREWEKFIKSNYTSLIDYAPIEESGAIFWRTYGSGYDQGKYILSSSEKLIKFNSNYYDLLPKESVMRGIYLVSSLGQNAELRMIENNVPYELKPGEYLFIEYTPASTDESLDKAEPIQKVYKYNSNPKERKLIRISGFDTGLMDSSDYGRLNNAAVKEVAFKLDNTEELLPVYRFAASEQLEIISPSSAILDQETLDVVYLYKNFHNTTLEMDYDKVTGESLGERRYTLKDGEYIFYTNKNKIDFAYFGSGTEVVLKGNITIPKSDILDIATLLDTGINNIPWQSRALGSQDSITFNEFKYITLGANDKIENLTLTNAELDADGNEVLTGSWTACATSPTYQLDGASTSVTLTEIASMDRLGCGWEARCFLALKTSPSETQTLRYEKGVINTGLLFSDTEDVYTGRFSPKDLAEAQGKNSAIINFKTNVDCVANDQGLNISDLTTNTSNEKGFKLKIFSTDEPTIVETQPNQVVPITQIPLTSWVGQPIADKDLLDLWHQVSLNQIMANQTNDSGVIYDNALALPILTTTNTYGIVCFYLKYADTLDKNSDEAKTWIEIMPGMSHDDVVIINSDNNIWESAQARSGESDKLFLNPGINCVRFNKSGKFFVKTAKTTLEDSKGDLYFADIKLVDCDVLSFTSSNDTKSKKKLLSNGLNLEQLGYFHIDKSTEAEQDILDPTTVSNLVKALCKSAITDSNTLARNAKIQFNEDSIDFINTISALEKIQTDISSNINDTNACLALLTTYQDINSTLTLESDLLEALKNKTADDKLLAFINQLATKETADAQISKALEDIKFAMDDEQQIRTNTQILASFRQNLTSKKPELKYQAERALMETKNIILQQADDAFVQELSDLVSEISGVINDNSLTILKSALQTLRETFIKEKNEVIQSLLNELITSIDTAELSSLLTDIVTATNEKDFIALAKLLTNLSEAVNRKEYDIKVKTLQEALSNQNNTLALSAITQIRNLDVEIENITQDIADIQTEINKASPDQAKVVSYVNTLINTVKQTYNDKLAVLLNNIEDELNTTIFDSKSQALNDFIESIKEDDDKVIKSLLDKIDLPKTTYKELRTAINTINKNTTWDTIKTSSYVQVFKKKIVEVWPKYLSEIIKNKFAEIESDIASIVGAENPAELIDEPTSGSGALIDELITIPQLKDKVENYFNFFVKADQVLLTKEQLNTLVFNVEAMCLNEQKNKVISKTVKDIGKLLGVTSSFSTSEQDKFDMLSESAKDRTQPIVKLLIELTGNDLDPLQKAQLITKLKNEISTAKILDTQLLTIILDYLYPSIVSIKKSFSTKRLEYKIALEVEQCLLNNTIEDNISEKLKMINNNLSNLIDIFNSLKEVKKQFTSDPTSAQEINSYKELIQNYSELAKEAEQSFNLIFISKDNFSILNSLYEISLLIIQAEKLQAAKLLDKLSIDDKTAEIEKLLAEDIFAKYNEQVQLLLDLKDDLVKVKNKSIELDESSTISLSTIALENQLLKEILDTDKDRDFYYTAPIEPAVAIDLDHFAEDNKTLLNPALNYDINNINNSFVISKLDIGYLDNGIQLARSSKLNY